MKVVVFLQEAEALTLAFASYVTNSGLAGTTATFYGFAVSATGLASATANVGENGAAFGLRNNLVITIGELLSRLNARSRKGLIWDFDASGSFNSAETILRAQAKTIFAAINNT